MTTHDAATALAAAILPDLPDAQARFLAAYTDHPAVAAFAAGTVDRDTAVRALVDAACAQLRARTAVIAGLGAVDRAA